MYAEIIINSDALEIDRMFTYKIPDNVTKKIGIDIELRFHLEQEASQLKDLFFL